MKSMFDNYFGGRVSSRAQMVEKIRNMETKGNVITETYDVINAITPAQQVELREEAAKERKFKLVSSESSFAPYVGDCVVR